MATELPDFSVKSDDLLPVIMAQLTTDEDTPQVIDLTTATSVRFIMASDLDGIPGTVKVDAVASFGVKANGMVQYAWVLGDTDVPGRYLAEWEVVWSNGKPQTFPTRSYHTIEIGLDLGGTV